MAEKVITTEARSWSRSQREAVNELRARLLEVTQLLEQLTRQVDAIAGNAELRAGAGYGWFPRHDADELTELRKRAELADTIAARIASLSPKERRQLEQILKWDRSLTR